MLGCLGNQGLGGRMLLGQIAGLMVGFHGLTYVEEEWSLFSF